MRDSKVLEKAKDMDWQTAVALVNTAVDLHASRIAADGQFSPKAVDKSTEVQAAWRRIQRG